MPCGNSPPEPDQLRLGPARWTIGKCDSRLDLLRQIDETPDDESCLIFVRRPPSTGRLLRHGFDERGHQHLGRRVVQLPSGSTVEA